MTNNLELALTVAREATILAGRVLNKYWGKLNDVKSKEYSWDLVTEADREAEEEILPFIKSHFPDHSILAEESGLHKAKDEDWVWAIDPLDGTTNYTHQIPFVATSIGLVHKGIPVVGAIYNPILNEMYCAAQGLGATLNGQKLRVTKTNEFEKSLLATGFPYDRVDNLDNNYKEFCAITDMCQGVRRLGSAAMDFAYVAAGRLEGFWEHGLHPWDMAAGAILVSEAGGKVTSYEGKPFDIYSRRVIATNGHIHGELQDTLSKLMS